MRMREIKARLSHFENWHAFFKMAIQEMKTWFYIILQFPEII